MHLGPKLDALSTAKQRHSPQPGLPQHTSWSKCRPYSLLSVNTKPTILVLSNLCVPDQKNKFPVLAKEDLGHFLVLKNCVFHVTSANTSYPLRQLVRGTSISIIQTDEKLHI